MKIRSIEEIHESVRSNFIGFADNDTVVALTQEARTKTRLVETRIVHDSQDIVDQVFEERAYNGSFLAARLPPNGDDR